MIFWISENPTKQRAQNWPKFGECFEAFRKFSKVIKNMYGLQSYIQSVLFHLLI